MKKLAIWRLPVALLFLGFTPSLLFSQTDFDDIDRLLEQQFQETDQALEEQFRRIEEAVDRAYRGLTEKIEVKWDADTLTPSQHRWVNYFDDLNSRTIVDYETGTIVIETIVQEQLPDKQHIEKLVGVATELVSMTEEQASQSDVFQKAVTQELEKSGFTLQDDTATNNSPLVEDLLPPDIVAEITQIDIVPDKIADKSHIETAPEPPQDIVDNPPSLFVPASLNLKVNNKSGLDATDDSIAVFLAGAIASDDHDQDLAVSHDAPDIFPLGTTEVTFTVIDSSQHLVSEKSSLTLTLVDIVAPVLSLPEARIIEIDSNQGLAANSPQIAAFLATATATDDIDGDSVVVHNAPDLFPPGDTVVTFAAEDSAGNSITVSVTLTLLLVDKVPPKLTVPTPLVVEVDTTDGIASSSELIETFLVSAAANDNIDGDLSVAHNAPSQFGIGTTKVSFWVSDNKGNESTADSSVTLILNDKIPPTINPPVSLTLEVNDTNGLAIVHPQISDFLKNVVVNDNADGFVTSSHDAPAIFPVGTTTVKFRASDKAGNESVALSSVELKLVDIGTPSISVPQTLRLDTNTIKGISAQHEKIQQFINGVIATDDIDSHLQVKHNAPNDFVPGATSVTFVASDKAGNTGQAVATVIVTLLDNTPPNLIPPEPLTIEVNNTQGLPQDDHRIVSFLTSVQVSDDIDDKVKVNHDAPVVFPTGKTQVNFIANDKDANSTTANSAVILKLVDNTLPQLTTPGTLILETKDKMGMLAVNPQIVSFLAAAHAMDNIDGVLPVENDAPDIFPVGETSVTFSAMDKAGNKAKLTSGVRVKLVDIEAPVISLSKLLVLEVTDSSGIPRDNERIQAFLKKITAEDNIDGSIKVNNNAPAVFPVGLTSVEFSATDSSGNVRQARSIVKLVLSKPDPKPVQQPVPAKAPNIAIKKENGVVKLQISIKFVNDFQELLLKRNLDTIKDFAQLYQVPVSTILAIIETESSYNPRAKSSIPAFGLMQLVPRTAGIDAYYGVYGEKKVVSPEYLYVERNNLELGTAYFNILLTRYLKGVKDPQSRFYCAIASYNTGIGNLSKTFAGTKIIKEAEPVINNMSAEQVLAFLLQNLPATETKNYLKKIIKRKQKYLQFDDGEQKL